VTCDFRRQRFNFGLCKGFPYIASLVIQNRASEIYCLQPVDVRLLGVTISSDLILQRHVSNVSATSFYWLHQIRRVRRSLDSESAATLVHAFITSHVDQCNAVLAGATKSVTNTLQHIMNAATRVVSDTRKFDHGLTRILHEDLHWLDVADRVTYKFGVIMHRCQHDKAPRYLVDCCTSATDVVGRRRLMSATQQLMVVPRHRLSTVGRRAFAVHGPMVWNSLPDDLHTQQDFGSFKQGLKTWLFSGYTSVRSALDICDNRAI